VKRADLLDWERDLLDALPYRLLVDGRMVTRGTLREIQAAVAGLVTTWLAEDPVGLADDAVSLNLAFQGGAVEESLDVWGDWGMTVGEGTGQPVRLQVVKEEQS
jgi:hypothetical protein